MGRAHSDASAVSPLTTLLVARPWDGIGRIYWRMPHRLLKWWYHLHSHQPPAMHLDTYLLQNLLFLVLRSEFAFSWLLIRLRNPLHVYWPSICISSSVKCLFISSIHYSFRLFAFLLICRSSNPSYSNPSLAVCVANTNSQFVSSFTFLYCILWWMEILNFNMVEFIFYM